MPTNIIIAGMARSYSCSINKLIFILIKILE